MNTQAIVLDPAENPVGTVPNGIAPFKFRFDPSTGEESFSFVIETPKVGHIFWEHIRRVDKLPLRYWAAGLIGYPPDRSKAVAVRPIVDGETAVGYEIRLAFNPPWWYNSVMEMLNGNQAVQPQVG